MRDSTHSPYRIIRKTSYAEVVKTVALFFSINKQRKANAEQTTICHHYRVATNVIPLLQLAGHGSTVRRETANKRLTRLFCQSWKRLPKRLTEFYLYSQFAPAPQHIFDVFVYNFHLTLWPLLSTFRPRGVWWIKLYAHTIIILWISVPQFYPLNSDCSLLNNYRPISLLSVFHKLLEKLMAIRVTKFLEIHDILYKYQCGFKKRYSTVLAVIDVVEDILEHLDRQEIGIGIAYI